MWIHNCRGYRIECHFSVWYGNVFWWEGFIKFMPTSQLIYVSLLSLLYISLQLLPPQGMLHPRLLLHVCCGVPTTSCASTSKHLQYCFLEPLVLLVSYQFAFLLTIRESMCQCLLKCNAFKDKHGSPHYSVWEWWELRKVTWLFSSKNLRHRNTDKYSDSFINCL
jgi:hypothetical protein